MTKEQTARFCNWLKEQRAKREISLATLSQHINVAPRTVGGWEKGEVAYGYIRHGLRHFFERWDRLRDKGELVCEIPDNGKPQLSTGAWLSWWMDTEGVSVAELSEKLDVTESCVYRWKKPETKLSIIAEYAIRQAMRDLGK